MKPATAAKKLGVHPDETPEEFRAGVVSRDELDALQADITEPLTTAQIAALKEEPPEWLRRERGNRAEAQRAEARLRAERSGRRHDDPVGG